MSRRQLTAKQNAFLKYLSAYLEDHGIWPTYREIVDTFGYRSPNSVTQNLQALYKKGFLRRDEEGFQLVKDRSRRTGIPIKGIITAGVLQEAVEENLGTITLESLFPDFDRLFAIRVSGVSMIGADIHDGDYVLLMQEDVRNGDIGAVLYNGETTLKRIFYDENGLRLEAANPEYDDIHIKPGTFEEVRVLGRYVGHVNRTGIFKQNSMAHA